MKPGVILATHHPCAALARALLLAGDIEILTILERNHLMLEHAGIPHRSLLEGGEELGHEAEVDAEARLEIVEKGLASEAFREEWAEFGDEDWPALRRAMLEPLKENLPLQILLIKLLRRSIAETDVRLVIVQPCITADTRTLVRAAHTMGIPSLYVQDGVYCGTYNCHDRFPADMLAVFSEESKAHFERMGCPSSRIAIAGNTEWDMYSGPFPPGIKEQTCERLGLDAGRPIVEYAGTCAADLNSTAMVEARDYHIKTTWDVIDAFSELASRHPDWQFVFRPHPGEQESCNKVREYAAGRGLALVVDTETPSRALAMADAMVCTHSNLGIEAILCGKPVVNVAIDTHSGRIFKEGAGPLFRKDDCVRHAREKGEIAPAIEDVLLNGSTRKWFLAHRPSTIGRFLVANDGKATERLTGLALEMMEDPARYLDVPIVRTLPPMKIRGAEPGPFAREERERRRRAEALNCDGEARFEHGDIMGAARAFSEAARVYPKSAETLSNLAVALHALRQPQEAWDRLLQALHIDPHLGSARENLMSVAHELGRQEEAERILSLFGPSKNL